MPERSKHPALRYADRDMLMSVARRLGLLAESDETTRDMDRNAVKKAVLREYKKMKPAKFRRKLGLALVTCLQGMVRNGMETGDGILLSKSETAEEIQVMDELERMGLAVKTESGEWLTDRLILPLLEGISEREADFLAQSDILFRRMHAYLRFWGAVEVDVLADHMVAGADFPSNVPLDTILIDLATQRLGMEALYRTPGGKLFLLYRDTYSRDDLVEAVGSYLWNALPYAQPEEKELEMAMNGELVEFGSSEYTYIAFLAGDENLPGADELDEEETKALSLRLIQTAPQGESFFVRLAQARRMVMEGRKFDALEFLMYNIDIVNAEAETAFRTLCEHMAASYGQWRFKGWCELDIRACPFLSDYRRADVISAEPGQPVPQPGFYELCPCGSGRLYGHCHGRAN